MKIASLVPYKIFPPIKGGEKAIALFLTAISKHADVTCFTVNENAMPHPNPSPNGEGQILSFDKINFVPVLGNTKDKSRYINLSLYRRIKQYCHRENITHIIIEHPYYGWLGWLLKKRAGIRFILRSHNIEAMRFKTTGKWWWPVLYQYEKFVHRHADYNFFITGEDQDFAIQEYGVLRGKCAVITYGMNATHPPPPEVRQESKDILYKELGLEAGTKLLLFNGTLDYTPNREALEKIVTQINPVLKNKLSLSYKIIICGPGLPPAYQSKKYTDSNLVFKGFVPDIDLYFNAADIFINPVSTGGGIKTKLVEALAANNICISFETGAYGIPLSVTGNHLHLVKDDDCGAFAEAIAENIKKEGNIPPAFFEHFNWDAIAKKALHFIQ